MTEDDDLNDLCPDGWSLTRKWALKQALKEYSGIPCMIPNLFHSFSCHIVTTAVVQHVIVTCYLADFLARLLLCPWYCNVQYPGSSRVSLLC